MFYLSDGSYRSVEGINENVCMLIDALTFEDAERQAYKSISELDKFEADIKIKSIRKAKSSRIFGEDKGGFIYEVKGLIYTEKWQKKKRCMKIAYKPVLSYVYADNTNEAVEIAKRKLLTCGRDRVGDIKETKIKYVIENNKK